MFRNELMVGGDITSFGEVLLLLFSSSSISHLSDGAGSVMSPEAEVGEGRRGEGMTRLRHGLPVGKLSLLLVFHLSG